MSTPQNAELEAFADWLARTRDHCRRMVEADPSYEATISGATLLRLLDGAHRAASEVEKAQIDQQALIKALHAERTEANSLHVDCWACEAAHSKAITDLLHALRLAQGEREHAHAVIARLVPDEEERHQLWRDYWRDLLSDTRKSPEQQT